MHAICRTFITIFFIGILTYGKGMGVTIQELEVAIKQANPREAEHFTVQLEQKGQSKILKIGRKIIVNPLRYMIQVQFVNLQDIEKFAFTDKIGNRTEPWVKLRCKKGRDDVQVVEQVFVEGELNEFDSKEEARTVLVIPCDPYEIEKLTKVLTDFLTNH